MKDRSALLGSLGAAVLASACCLAPLALGALGLGSLGVGAALAPASGLEPLITAVKRAGYDASPAHPRATVGGAAALSALAGQWRGHLVVGEGKTSELIVDLGVVGDRWAGQFDLHDFGVEDYPVDVAIDGQRVTLHLSAARIDFEGLLAGDVLAGMAKAQGVRDSLVLKRTGEAHFTDDFLALERVADDPTRLEPLSRDATALRKRFNDDREYTRLVMLLSPS